MARKCPTTGKTQYFSHKAARKGIMFIWGNDPSVGMTDLHSYRCGACGLIHIGHRFGTKPKPVENQKV